MSSTANVGVSTAVAPSYSARSLVLPSHHPALDDLVADLRDDVSV